MRAVRLLARGAAAAAVLLAVILPASSTAALQSRKDLPIWVGAYGVAFSPVKVDGDTVTYRIRALDGSDDARLTEPVPDGAGWVGFSDAYTAIPGGYCVTSVTVPGIGTWDAARPDDVCTPANASATPSPSATASPSSGPGSVAAATPTPTAPEKQAAASAAPSASPAPALAASSTASPTVVPSASPSPSSSPSPSDAPSPSPSASASPHGSPEPEPTSSAAAALSRALQDSLAPRTPVAEEENTVVSLLEEDPRWSAVGMLVAVGAITAGGVGLWRSQRRPDDAPTDD